MSSINRNTGTAQGPVTPSYRVRLLGENSWLPLNLTTVDRLRRGAFPSLTVLSVAGGGLIVFVASGEALEVQEAQQ